MPRHNGRKVPANIRPYVAALGVDDAFVLLLKIGGTEIYLPHQRSGEDSFAASIVGSEKVLALADAFGGGAGNTSRFRLPVAGWLM